MIIASVKSTVGENVTVGRGADARAQAEELLRAGITRGEFVPGQRLLEVELAVAFGVTRSSVRLAIDNLVGEGLVERVANRGARVRKLTVAEAIEVTECRRVLTGLLARKAACRATAAQIRTLHKQIDTMKACLATGDLLGYSDRISELYQQIYEISNHQTGAALASQLQAQLVRQQFQLSLRPGRTQVSMRELSDVVAAIANHDPDAAERLIEAHLQGVADMLREEEH